MIVQAILNSLSLLIVLLYAWHVCTFLKSMVLRINASILVIKLQNIAWFGASVGSSFQCICSSAFLTIYNFVCAVTLWAIHLLSLHLLAIICDLCPASFFPFMSMSVSHGGIGAGPLSSTGRSRDVWVDSHFRVSDSICDYGAYMDPGRFAAMHMNRNSASVWDGCSRRNGDTAVGAWRSGGGILGGHVVSVRRCTSTAVATSFVHCFEEVDCGGLREGAWATSCCDPWFADFRASTCDRNDQVSKRIRAVFCCLTGLNGNVRATLSIVSEYQVGPPSLVGIASGYTPCQQYAFHVVSGAYGLLGWTWWSLHTEGVYSAGVLELFQFGASSASEEWSWLYHHSHRVSSLDGFQFLRAIGNGTDGFTCRDDCMCRNGRALGHLATEICKYIDEIGLSSFQEG